MCNDGSCARIKAALGVENPICPGESGETSTYTVSYDSGRENYQGASE